MKVADVMTTQVLTVKEDCSVIDALRLMLKERISGLPVVNAQGALSGIVTEGDFLRRSELGTARKRSRWLELLIGPGRLAGEYTESHGRRVGEVMSPGVVTVAGETLLEQAVALMEQHQIKRLPVVDGRGIVGILSRSDLLRALLAMSADPASRQRADEAILADFQQQLDSLPWTPRATVGASVEGGVLKLRGTLVDDRARTALCVMAENIPGVLRVDDQMALIEPMTGYVISTPTLAP